MKQTNKHTHTHTHTHSHIPSNYQVLLQQGGGTAQFAAIPLNLTPSENSTADYLITGTWSTKAAKEGGKFVKVNRILPKTKSFTTILERSEWNLSSDAAYVYYCANETVDGEYIRMYILLTYYIEMNSTIILSGGGGGGGHGYPGMCDTTPHTRDVRVTNLANYGSCDLANTIRASACCLTYVTHILCGVAVMQKEVV